MGTSGSAKDANRAAASAFLTAAATLFTQILVHRMVSAKLLNNYAFLVISLTMLGFALSGVVLSQLLPRFLARRNDALCLCAALFATSLIGSAAFFYHADTAWSLEFNRATFVASLLRRLPLALPLATPFLFCGLILGTLLSDPRLSARRVYCFDLAGSGLGALLVIPAIARLGAETSLIVACVAMLVGTVLVAPPSGRLARAGVALAALLIAATAAFESRVFDLNYPAGTLLAAAKAGTDGMKLEYGRWDPVAHIEVSRIPPPTPESMQYPCLIGTNTAFHARFRRVLTQNNFAFTYAVDYDGTPESLRGIEETIYASAYQAKAAPRPRVGIIGVGGGFDILNALYFDAGSITAIEVNAATFDLLHHAYGDYFRHWVEDPRLNLVLGEGRHYLVSHDERFDVLQLSGVDSYSGTPGAAHVFSESYLYTAEAMDLYLSRLTDRGILNMMRLELRPPQEMLRALVTATEALRRIGVAHPARNIVTLTASNGAFTALLVKRTAFTEDEERALADWAGRSPYFGISASPSSDPAGTSLYKRFLALDDPQKERAFVAAYPFDIRPVGDDRPFFFKFSRWSHLFAADPVVRRATPVTELSLLALFGVIAVAAVACVYLPLRLFVSRNVRMPGKGRYATFFAATAVGYLAIEVALLQKFGLFLGHPNYALSVVLAALLVATGLGSLVSAALVRAAGGLRFVAYGLAALILLEYFAAFPRLPGWMPLPFVVRCLLTCLCVAPIGVALGTFVPSALDQVKATSPDFAPWAWGVSGIFSVLAPVLAIALSMTWGINALLLAAIPVYLVAALALPDPALPA